MMNSSMRKQVWADVLLLLVTMIWGSTFVMVKDAVSAYPVFPFIAIRFGFATLALLALAWRHLPTLGWRGWGAGALIGLCLFAGYGFQTAGLQETSASKTGFITGLSVVLVPILSAVLLRKLPSFAAIIGVALATVGLGLLTLVGQMEIAMGDLLVLACALSFALHIVSVSAFASDYNPMALTFVQVLTVAVISGIVSLFTDQPLPKPLPSTWFAAAFTGILATAVAFGLQTSMQRLTTPTHTALIFTGEPVFAAIFGVLLAGDQMTSRAIIGGLLIVVGTVISEVPWSQRTARVVSRFLSPHYVVVPLLIALGLADPVPWQEGLLWAFAVMLVGVIVPLMLVSRELRRGGISDWHMSVREERLKPIPIIASIAASALPLLLIQLFGGPRTLTVAFLSALSIVLVNLLITVWWKISQHVASIAATATLATGLLGLSASPVLLLIPLVAWARVKVGAHTVMQTVAGGFSGCAVAGLVLWLSRTV